MDLGSVVDVFIIVIVILLLVITNTSTVSTIAITISTPPLPSHRRLYFHLVYHIDTVK